MSDNEGNEVSLAKTEELGEDEVGKLTEEEVFLAPGPGEYQPLSSSSDDDDNDGNDRADDKAEGMEHDSELPNEGSAFGTIIQISVITISNSSGESVSTILYVYDSNVSGGGLIKYSTYVANIFELELGYYELAFTGCGLCTGSEDDGGGKQTKVYNFQIVENDTEISNSSDGSSDEEENDLEEAWKKPLIPAQLPLDIPTFWEVKMGMAGGAFRIAGNAYRAFMDQISHSDSQNREDNLELLIELSGEPYGRFYTSFKRNDKISISYLRQAARFRRLAEFHSGDVVRMHYLGYRVRENDTNVYCLRSEKISTAETTNRPDPSAVMLQRSTRTRKPNVLYHEKYVKSVKLRYRQRRVPSKAAMAAQPHQERGANLVKKKAQLESDRSDIQGPSQLHTSTARKTAVSRRCHAPGPEVQKQRQGLGVMDMDTPSPFLSEPGLGRLLQHAQAGELELPPQQLPPPQQQQQQQQQMQAEEAMPQAPQPQSTQAPQTQQQPLKRKRKPKEQPFDWVSLVTTSLINRSDLDRGTVGNYLLLFATFTEQEMETYGKIIVHLAADSSVTALETLLKGAIQQRQGVGNK